MTHAPSFVLDLALVLAVASAAGLLFRWLGQPLLLGYLVAGLVVGPYIPIPIFADPARVESLAEFGVILVMFSVGLEFSLKRLGRVLPKSGVSAVVQMSLLAWAGFLLGRGLAWSPVESVFLGAAIAISSTMVVAKVFEVHRPGAAVEEFAYGVLVVQDVAAVALIAVLTALASGSSVSAGEVAGVVGELAAVLSVMVALGLLILPRLMARVADLGNGEVLLVTSVGVCFGMAVLAESLGYSVALGSFIAGMLVAESGRSHRIQKLILPLKDLFAAVFFVAIGMLVDPRLVAEHAAVAVVVAAIVIAGQFASISLAGVLTGNPLTTSIRTGLSLGQIGEFSFIMVGIGTAAGVVRPALLPIVVTAATLTAFTTPMTIRASQRIAAWVEHHLPRRIQTLLTLYGTWFESPDATPPQLTQRRRLIRVMAIDGAVIIAVTVGVSLGSDRLESLLDGHVLPATWALPAVTVVAILVMIPFVIGMLRSARALAHDLAEATMPAHTGTGPDLSASPRKMFIVGLQLALLIVVGAPIVALTQPFVSPFSVSLVYASVLLIAAVHLWRSAADLQAHVRASAEALLELFASGTAVDAEHPVFADLAASLGNPTVVTLATAAPACDRSLAELDVRAKTGVSVIAISRNGEGIVIPHGHEILRAGDVLALAGTTEALDAARTMLVGAP